MEDFNPEKKALASAYAMKKRSKRFAKGGMAGEMESGYEPSPMESDEEPEGAMDEDNAMLARIFSKKAQMLSKGGMVANDVGVAEADKLPAEYDDLVLRDDLESDYDGENSGDMDGSGLNQEKDMVTRIMRRRR